MLFPFPDDFLCQSWVESALKMPSVNPYMIKPPGAIPNISMGSKPFPSRLKPNAEPLLSISRIMPISVIPKVKPIPMPTPSPADANTLLLLAKASARARIMQLTTMSGRKIPNAEYHEGR